MKVVASHTCPVCGSCYRKHSINNDGKMVKWCSSPICEVKDERVLAGKIESTKER